MLEDQLFCDVAATQLEDHCDGVKNLSACQDGFEAAMFKIMQMWKATEEKFEMAHVLQKFKLFLLKMDEMIQKTPLDRYYVMTHALGTWS